MVKSAKGFLNASLATKVVVSLIISIAVTSFALAQEILPRPENPSNAELTNQADNQQTQILVDSNTLRTAIFAGGCFWCMEPPFDALPGVHDTTAGYTGGTTPDPTYAEVAGKATGHYEAVRVTYNPNIITYAKLLEIFWRNIDPLDDKGQFCDRGTPYLSAIFVDTEEERTLAEESKQKTQKDLEDKGTVVTRILQRAKFYEAEEYHQNYAQKNQLRYKYYRKACKRDFRLEELWGLIFS
ncbi:peptide-methionine (S)-S-oxide reductase [bacterium]|nr:peptide-methionine (S)-S-oxide reductase [bacterium]